VKLGHTGDMANAFLIASLVGLAYVLNAKRPLRLQLSIGIAFFNSWLVSELAPQLLVLDLIGTGFFVWNGALSTWPGWVALAVSALRIFVLVGLVRDAYRVADVLDTALTEAIGPAESRARVVWREFAFPFKLWSRRIRRIRDIPYAEPGGRRLRLDVWFDKEAKEERSDRPCLLYVPGGAWTSFISNKNHQAKPLLIEMASRGWVCFAVNYPVSPRAKFPAHIIAVKRAIAWVREHANEYGGDARFLMISGNSAGGHLSSLAALTPNDPAFQPDFEDADTTLQAAAPFYGVYDWTGAMLDELPAYARRHKAGMIRFLERAVMKAKIAAGREPFESASPWFHVGPHAPPFFVLHGSNDLLALVHEARAFVARLREVSKEPVIYAELPGTQHAFDHFLSIRALYAVRAIARFGEWAWLRWLNGAGRPSPSSDRANRSPTSGR
jgi:acetyl esterase/lipase